MFFKFNSYGTWEEPVIVLSEIGGKIPWIGSKTDGELIGKLVVNRVALSLQYCGISELKFNVPRYIDGESYIYYPDVKELRMVYLNDIGWFQLHTVDEVSDGVEIYKECVAYSAECMLQSRKLAHLEGEYKLYDTDNADKGLLNLLMPYIPNWELGDIDGTLLSRQRNISVTAVDIYSLLTKTVSEVYECLFIFDFKNFKIHVKDIQDEHEKIPASNICMTYHNLLKNVKSIPQTDKIITALHVTGGDELGIEGVNPTRSDTIYNFGEFKSRMSRGLQESLSAYEKKYEEKKVEYIKKLEEQKKTSRELLDLRNNAPEYAFSNALEGVTGSSPTRYVSIKFDYKTVNTLEYYHSATNKTYKYDMRNPNTRSYIKADGSVESIDSESGLAELETLLKCLEGVKKARLDNAQLAKIGTTEQLDSNGNKYEYNELYGEINAAIKDVEYAIEKKKEDIQKKEQQLNEISEELTQISASLKMNSHENFTDAQWRELTQYIREDSIQENAFIVTENMTLEQQEEMKQELFEFGERVLAKNCVSKYMFEISCVNFLALPEFKDFREGFSLGSTFALKIDDYVVVHPMLLGVEVKFDDPSDFNLKFGTRYNLDDGFQFYDALRQSVNMGSAISFDFVKIQAMKKQSTQVANFMKDALVAAVNNIKSTNEKTEVEITEYGLKLKSYDAESGNELGYQSWITGSQMIFSDDKFENARLALGRINAPGGDQGVVYGVIRNECCSKIIRLVQIG